MQNQQLVEESYKQIRDALREICYTDDEVVQEETKNRWLECIDHRDYERIPVPIGVILGVLETLGKMAPDAPERDKEFEDRARGWAEVIGMG